MRLGGERQGGDAAVLLVLPEAGPGVDLVEAVGADGMAEQRLDAVLVRLLAAVGHFAMPVLHLARLHQLIHLLRLNEAVALQVDVLREGLELRVVLAVPLLRLLLRQRRLIEYF